jgi:hypothetical protein
MEIGKWPVNHAPFRLVNIASGVEGEVNGLLTYDREVGKVPPERLRELHAPLFAPAKPQASDTSTRTRPGS